VVVAWKDTREARRAVHDAIPFLEEAEQVMIVTVCDSGTETQAQQQIGDIESCLRRHKVVVKIQAYLHTKRTVAGALLRFAQDEKADLIVAGGYGHSRLGEWMLGGVTRDLLSDSPLLPVLALSNREKRHVPQLFAQPWRLNGEPNEPEFRDYHGPGDVPLYRMHREPVHDGGGEDGNASNHDARAGSLI
jgi:nucleotide-binding universal stress UspA family protein